MLEPQTVINIRKYRIFRRLSRGGRWNRELLREQRSVVRRVSLNNLHVIKCAKSDHTYAAHQMNMTMSTVNVQSITRRKKDMAISDILHEFKLDMCVLTETWLTNQDNDEIWVESCELNKNGYKLDVSNRNDKTGGGLELVYRDNLKVKSISKGALQSFEYAKWTIMSKSCSFSIIGIYHPPYSLTNKITNAMFLEDFIPCCANCVITDRNIIITGDFNIHVNDVTNSEAMSFTDSMEALRLIQYVKFVTHRLGNTLDLVFLESSKHLNVSTVCPGLFMSDHCFVMWTTSIPREDLTSKTVSTRKIKSIDVDRFVGDINLDRVVEMDNPDEIVNEIDITLSKTLLDTHAPMKTKTVTVRHKQPWFSDAISDQKKVVRRCEKTSSCRPMAVPVY